MKFEGKVNDMLVDNIVGETTVGAMKYYLQKTR